jgi:hypothetical protein
VADLFYGGAAYPDWQAFNWRHRRFYLLNAKRMLGLLRVSHTSSDPYFGEAMRIIEAETEWPKDFPADYSTSKTQIYPQRIEEPKLLAKALTTVVALECIARAQDSKINVYDHLRIVPAWYFLDGFDRDLHRNLAHAFEQLSVERKQQLAKKADVRVGADFDEVCLRQVGQTPGSGLLRQLASGYCVTRDVAEGIARFIKSTFAAQWGSGPVRVAGESGSDPILGTKDAAPALRRPSGPEKF